MQGCACSKELKFWSIVQANVRATVPSTGAQKPRIRPKKINHEAHLKSLVFKTNKQKNTTNKKPITLWVPFVHLLSFEVVCNSELYPFLSAHEG